MATATQSGIGIRAELSRRIASIDARADRLRPGQLAVELEALRREASTNGFGPAVTVIHVLDAALSRGEHGSLVHDWLAILHDAIDCGRSDARTCETYAAACSVRLGA